MSRLERLLLQLGQQHIAAKLPSLPSDPHERNAAIADLLADEAGILVLRGDFPKQYINQSQYVIEHWVKPYVTIYDLIARTLFSTQRHVYWVTIDNNLPPILLVTGELYFLTGVLAHYVAPYVAERQRNPLPQYSAELRGICGYMLDEVGGEDLSPRAYNQLREALMNQVRLLIQQAIRQRNLTTAADNLFTQTPSNPMAAITDPPSTLPETPSERLRRDAAQEEGNEMLTDSKDTRGPHNYPADIPIFYNGRHEKRVKPPVPLPPNMKRRDKPND